MPDMKLQNLWYVRRGERISGPFPEKWISRDLMLGRLTGDDQISLDRVNWVALGQRPELAAEAGGSSDAAADAPPDWNSERRRARLRWADERRQLDRRSGREQAVEEDHRRRADRRHPESAEVLLQRQRHAELEQALRIRRDRYFGVAFVLLALLALAAWAVLRFTPVNPVPVDLGRTSPDCRAPAAPQINWSGCDQAGAWLRGVDLRSAMLTAARFNAANLSLSRLEYANLVRADLSYANLQGARLQAANLQQADLSYADLRNADLSLADLRGARLDAADLSGARLHQAIWVDGRECQAGSVGACL
jgi:hypothetical protein